MTLVAKDVGDFTKSIIQDIRTNTIINFEEIPSLSKQDANILYQTSLKNPLPETFDWKNIYPTDTTEMKIIKRYMISKPPNQFLCGSCYAIAVAEMMSDCYAVSGMVNWEPNISETYALINYPQLKCAGGNPARLLREIAKGEGLSSRHCVDYSWCTKNSNCTRGSSSQHFNVNLSDLLPNEKGCFYKAKHFFYTLDEDKIRQLSINDNSITYANFQNLIKEHILTNGPVVGGLVIFRNFLSGNFTKMNGGVYLENGTYDGVSNVTFSKTNPISSNVSGGHVIVVIGWGIERNIKIGNEANEIADVPYWYCRNSWGRDWGDDGYFKIGMYPYNKIAQFSKTEYIYNPYRGGYHSSGGIIAITVTKPPILTDQAPAFTNVPPLIQAKNYYSKDENDIVEKFDNLEIATKALKSSNNFLWIILIVLILLIILNS
ncbi:hypothetical protein AGMMS49579_15240 [Spirochaetia bacterium]|nr:hypothetical protein AGMMS49579_15240 [Spirochaetia bacterium]